MAYLEIENVKKTFATPGGREIQALKDITFSLERGEILSIFGHNGSGKTTLLNCIRNSGFADSGRITIDGHEEAPESQRIISVFQDVGQGVVGSMTPIENLALTCSGRDSFLFGFPRRRYRQHIRCFLENAGLWDRFAGFEHTPTWELSGGQRQQVAIAMAIMRRPTILLLDEFVANLDPTVRHDILTWTKNWVCEQSITVLMVTHDHDLAVSWGDKVLELSDGEMLRFETAGGRE